VGSSPFLHGNILAFKTFEGHLNQDLNQDGDFRDWIIRYYDIQTQKVFNIGTIGHSPVVYDQRIAFATSENSIKEDLNEDGVIDGNIIQYFDLTSNQLVNIKELGIEPDLFEDKISYYRWEQWLNTDQTHDVDEEDPVLGLHLIRD